MANGKIQFQCKIPVLEAMMWELYKQSLNWALIDEAEKKANDAKTMVDGVPFDDVESESEIKVEGDDFVVTFRSPEPFTQDDAWKTRG